MDSTGIVSIYSTGSDDMNITGSDNDSYQMTETSMELNDRYAAALLPLTIIFGFLFALGILGNILTLLVFSLNREYRGNTFKVFVIALALIDLATCLTLFPTEILTHRYYFLFKRASLCKAKCFVTVFGASASCLALLVISVDRYRKVMQPLRRQLTPSLTIGLLVLAIFILPVLLAIPAAILCGINNTNKENIFGGQTEIYMCETEEKFKHSKWRTIYKAVLISLQLVVSIVYVILYAFVMKEALKHIRAIKTRESFSCSYAQNKPEQEYNACDNIQDSSKNNETTHVLSKSGGTLLVRNTNGSVTDTGEEIVMKNLNGSVSISGEETLINNITDVISYTDEETVMKKITSESDDISLENGHANLGRDSETHKEAAKRLSNISRIRMEKRKSLISKRSQISILSQRTEFPTKTLVWFVLTIIFIVTNATHNVLSLKRKDIVNMSTSELFWFLVFFRLYYLNHVINPVVYAIFLKSFRTTSRHTFSTIKERITSL